MLTIEIDDKYQYLYNKDTKSSLIIKQKYWRNRKRIWRLSNKYIRRLQYNRKDNEFILTDKELNEKFMSNEEIGTKIFGDFLLVYEDVEEPENCLYKIENNQLIEIGQPTKNWEVYANYLDWRYRKIWITINIWKNRSNRWVDIKIKEATI